MNGSYWHVRRFPYLFPLLVRVPRPRLHRPSLCFVSSLPVTFVRAGTPRPAPVRARRTNKEHGASLRPTRPRHIRRHIPPFLARPPARGCVASRGLGAPPSGRPRALFCLARKEKNIDGRVRRPGATDPEESRGVPATWYGRVPTNGGPDGAEPYEWSSSCCSRLMSERVG